MWSRRLTLLAAIQVLAAILVLASALVPARVHGADPHEVYERQCARCHEAHAGDFVAKNLVRRDGVVVGRAGGKEIGAFLAGGHGRLAASDVPVMVAQLTAISQSGGLYRERCRMCYDPATVFARLELVYRDGRVIGRYSGRDTREFLDGHGRIDGPEIDIIMRMLERQLKPAE